MQPDLAVFVQFGNAEESESSLQHQEGQRESGSAAAAAAPQSNVRLYHFQLCPATLES